MSDLQQPTPKQLADEHARKCLRCGITAWKYRREINQAEPLPDALLTKIRAQLCPAGAALFDALVLS